MTESTRSFSNMIRIDLGIDPTVSFWTYRYRVHFNEAKEQNLILELERSHHLLLDLNLLIIPANGGSLIPDTWLVGDSCEGWEKKRPRMLTSIKWNREDLHFLPDGQSFWPTR